MSTGSGSDRPPTSSGSPTDTRHRSSNKLLNLFRSKEKLPPNDLATLGTQPEPGPSSRLPSRAKNIAEGQTCFALNPQPSKATSSSPEKYHCLFCRKDYDCKGARGVFKRHLKDHHVAPLNKGYECYCGALFRKENEANAHVCEWRVFDWNEARLVSRLPVTTRPSPSTVVEGVRRGLTSDISASGTQDIRMRLHGHMFRIFYQPVPRALAPARPVESR